MLCSTISAQIDSTQILTKNFKFEDGIYTDFEQLQKNEPALKWTDVQTNLFTNPQTFITKIDYIQKDSTPLDLNKIWGIALGGIPYIRIDAQPEDSDLVYFVGLRVRGKICYFEYETQKTDTINMKAYNPITGIPFRSGVVTQQQQVRHPHMLHFETGEIRDFTKKAFLPWIADDQKLWKTVDELSEEEVSDKLFKCLLIYDDRQEVYVK